MAAVYHYPQPVWSQSQYYPQYVPVHTLNRGQDMRVAEQLRADEELALRTQAEEERLLAMDSMWSADLDRRRRGTGDFTRRSSPGTSSASSSFSTTSTLSTLSSLPTRSGSTRSSTPYSDRSRRPSVGPPVEPFIPPGAYPTPAPSPERAPRLSAPIHPPRPAPTQGGAAAPATPADELRDYATLFTRSLACSRCGDEMFVQPMVDISLRRQLHLFCARCPVPTPHCRGCGKPVACKRKCDAIRDDCQLKTCCRKGRAIAIFEILGLFDKSYTTAAESLSKSNIWPVPKSERDDFLQLATSNTDPRLTRPFNQTLTKTLSALQGWLPLEQSVHASVRLLFSTSLLLEVVRAYLKDTTAAYVNWVIYGELYTEILGLLKLFGREECHHALVMQSLPAIQRSSGLQSWLWDEQSVWSFDPNRTRKSLFAVAVADSRNIREELKKLGEKLRDPESKEFIAQFSMDLNHIFCMQVLS